LQRLAEDEGLFRTCLDADLVSTLSELDVDLSTTIHTCFAAAAAASGDADEFGRLAVQDQRQTT
jgi:hypothetical protein